LTSRFSRRQGNNFRSRQTRRQRGNSRVNNRTTVNRTHNLYLNILDNHIPRTRSRPILPAKKLKTRRFRQRTNLIHTPLQRTRRHQIRPRERHIRRSGGNNREGRTIPNPKCIVRDVQGCRAGRAARADGVELWGSTFRIGETPVEFVGEGEAKVEGCDGVGDGDCNGDVLAGGVSVAWEGVDGVDVDVEGEGIRIGRGERAGNEKE